MDKNEKLLNELYRKYFSDDYSYIDESRRIVSDIQYFQEHISRTKTSQKFSFTIIPSMEGCIYNGYVIKAMFNLYYCGFRLTDKDSISNIMKLFNLSQYLINNLQNKEEDSNAEEQHVNDLMFLDKLSLVFADIKVTDNLYCFIGSSYLHQKVSEKIEKYYKGESNNET